MNNEEYNFFVTVVAGENPKELMKKYDKKIKVEPYILYSIKDAALLKKEDIKELENEIKEKSKEENNFIEVHYLNEILENVKSESSKDFFYDYTNEFDHDEDGNAITTKNKNGRWSYYQEGKLFSVPFITYDGRETFQARKSEIDWSKMHLSGQEIYKRAWEMVMEHSNPQNDYEKNIYEKMKNRTVYFQRFNSKEDYVIYSTAFWAYAFLDENKWNTIENEKNEFKWVSEFYDKFIKPLDDNTLLTIFECKK